MAPEIFFQSATPTQSEVGINVRLIPDTMPINPQSGLGFMAFFRAPPRRQQTHHASSQGTASDDALMLALAGGDRSAFSPLYERYESPLYNFLLRSSGSPATAADLAQETWLSLVRARERYQPEGRFAAYLFHIANNKLIDHWRAARSEQPLGEENAEPPAGRQWQPEVQAESGQRLQKLIAAIQALPAEQRQAFLLQQEGGLSLEEIAQITGVGRETVKSRLRYALAKLRQEVGDD